MRRVATQTAVDENAQRIAYRRAEGELCCCVATVHSDANAVASQTDTDAVAAQQRHVEASGDLYSVVYALYNTVKVTATRRV